MKKLMLSLAAAGLAASSLGAYAALPTGAAPFQVNVPNLTPGLEFTVEGLYLQPSSSVSTYAYAPVGGNTADYYTGNINPQASFAWRAAVGYIFPNSGNDIQFSWTYFDHSTNSAQGNTYQPVFSTGNEIFNVGTGNNANQGMRYNAADLDVGQYVDWGTRFQTRLYAGARYAAIKSNIGDMMNPDYFAQMNTKFNGVGPRIGVDTSYNVTDCFGVVAHFAAALLVGYSNHSEYVLDVPTATTTSTGTFSSQMRVVPAFDVKLGVDYTVPFKNASALTIGAGYQVTEYVNAIDRSQFVSGVMTQAYSTTTTGSIGFNGPYLSLNYKL